MNKENTAENLIASRSLNVTIDPQNGWYLKRFAALQFKGSVDNFDKNMPIHVLEQQLPKDETMMLDDAVIEGQDFDYSKFYDERGNEYSSVSELVQTLLDLDNDDSIQEYNKENPDLPYIPYEKLREMDKKDIPELLLSVADEADYVDAYKEVTDIESWNVEVTPMSNNYETMGFAFTHQGLKEYEKSIDNHIFHFCRTYAYAGEQHNRREGDFYPIMELLHSAGEQLLRQDLRRYNVQPLVVRTPDEMDNFYRTQPNEMILAAYLEVIDKVSGEIYSKIRVWCCVMGREHTTKRKNNFPVPSPNFWPLYTFPNPPDLARIPIPAFALKKKKKKKNETKQKQNKQTINKHKKKTTQ